MVILLATYVSNYNDVFVSIKKIVYPLMALSPSLFSIARIKMYWLTHSLL